MLSPQEKEVLKYRQEGVPGREIAEKLGIKLESVWTISHTIVLKCTGQFDPKKQYEYVKKSFEKRMSESEENKRKFKEQQRQYRERNKEKIKNYSQKYYENNKERIARQHKEYYEANKEKISMYQKKYYENIKSNDSVPKKRTSRKAQQSVRNKEIYERFLSGESVTNIAKSVGLSRQRIYIIVADVKKSLDNTPEQ